MIHGFGSWWQATATWDFDDLLRDSKFSHRKARENEHRARRLAHLRREARKYSIAKFAKKTPEQLLPEEFQNF